MHSFFFSPPLPPPFSRRGGNRFYYCSRTIAIAFSVSSMAALYLFIFSCNSLIDATYSAPWLVRIITRLPLSSSATHPLSSSSHPDRSEERRVGKEGRSRWSPYH